MNFYAKRSETFRLLLLLLCVRDEENKNQFTRKDTEIKCGDNVKSERKLEIDSNSMS